MLTIPMIDWVAKLGANRGKLASFSIAKYGAQTGNDWQWFADAGNGVRQRTGRSSPATIPTTPTCRRRRSSSRAGCSIWSAAGAPAPNGGVRYYILDNEPSIWHSTHRDVHPTGATMDEIREQDRSTTPRKIKAVDPSALVVGPEEWGWSGYFYSGYDQQYGSSHGWSSLPDRDNHGGADYLPWLLDQLRQRSATDGPAPARRLHGALLPAGRRVRRRRVDRDAAAPQPLDALAVGSELRRRDAGSTIEVQLIPRLQGWVEHVLSRARRSASPNTTGAPRTTSTARPTQADISASSAARGSTWRARWTTPAATTPTYKAMKMYRNYDGNKIDVRRHQRRGGDRQSRQRRRRSRPQRSARRRADGDGRSTSSSSATPRPPSTSPTFGHGGSGAGLAADLGQRHHPARRRHGLSGNSLVVDAPGAEHHAVRGAGTATAARRRRRPTSASCAVSETAWA